MGAPNSYDIAASLVRHWLDASGTPVELNPSSMISEIPNFKKDVKGYLTGDAVKNGAFDSGWQRTRPVETDGASSIG